MAVSEAFKNRKTLPVYPYPCWKEPYYPDGNTPHQVIAITPRRHFLTKVVRRDWNAGPQVFVTEYYWWTFEQVDGEADTV